MSSNKYALAVVVLLATVLSIRAQGTCSPEEERYRCGYRGIDPFMCQTIGCCWDKGSGAHPCFLPDQLKPGGASSPVVEETEPTAPQEATGQSKVTSREEYFQTVMFDSIKKPKSATKASSSKRRRFLFA